MVRKINIINRDRNRGRNRGRSRGRE